MHAVNELLEGKTHCAASFNLHFLLWSTGSRPLHPLFPFSGSRDSATTCGLCSAQWPSGRSSNRNGVQSLYGTGQAI